MSPIQHHKNLKQQHGDDVLLLFRIGDWIELFHDDAQFASATLGLALTVRSKGGDQIPMAGFLYHQLDGYLGKLIKTGRRVAVCERVDNSVSYREYREAERAVVDSDKSDPPPKTVFPKQRTRVAGGSRLMALRVPWDIAKAYEQMANADGVSISAKMIEALDRDLLTRR